MKDIRDAFKTKDFTINPYVLKNILNINITLEEFLLLVYFMNNNKYLDLDSINSFLGIETDATLKIFNDLVSKGYLEIKVIKKDNTIEEEVCLDMFYDKLVLNAKEEKKNTNSNDIYSIFETEFGRTLSPFEYETINKWINNKVSEETIKNALREAVLNGVTNLRYIDKILYEWNKKGIKEDKRKEMENTEIFDYNWLGDETDD